MNSVVREALEDIQQYLNDAIAPLVAADSFSVLMKQPAEVLAGEIHSWTAAQYRGHGAAVPVSDYYFHALRKLHLLGEYSLVPKDSLAEYIRVLSSLLVESCPDEDREPLLQNLQRLGEMQTTLTSPTILIHRQPRQDMIAATPEATAASVNEIAKSSARLARILEKLDSARSLSTQPTPAAAQAAPTQAQPATEKTTRTTEVDDPVVNAQRLLDLVLEAVDHLNMGSLSGALARLDDARALMERHKVQPMAIESARVRGQEKIDFGIVRKLAEDTIRHAALRQIMAFFPSCTAAGLLDALHTEEKRDRRRMLLVLIEVHGAQARELALERLDHSANQFGDTDWQYQRNLLTILRRIPLLPGQLTDREIDSIVKLAEPGRPAGLLKEAVSNLGEARNSRCEQALARVLRQIEDMSLRPKDAPYPQAELWAILDRIAHSLASCHTPMALTALVEHGLKKLPALGGTSARLATLSTRDLSAHPGVVEDLLRALHAELPHKVFGIMRSKGAQTTLGLIAALAGTRTEPVRDALQSVADRFADDEIGRTAAKALSSKSESTPFGAAAGGPSLAGDLQVFGLPALLQNLAESRATGALQLKDGDGVLLGAIDLHDGKVIGCEAGVLKDAEAVFQLLERPIRGTFAFTNEEDDGGEDEAGAARSGREILPLIMEGMRRLDELKRASTIVADDVRLKPGEKAPTRLTAETDKGLQRAVWKRAVMGIPASECEVGMPCDAFRVRRLLAYWVSEGSLIAEGAARSSTKMNC